MATIRPLRAVGTQQVKEINGLLKQLRSNPASHKPISLALLRKVLKERNTVVLVALDGKKIVGTATIIWNQILTDKFAFVEDVVVDSGYRGQGIGRTLTAGLIAIARSKNVQTIGLTSRPSRIEANGLYPKLGFKLKKTNYYELDL